MWCIVALAHTWPPRSEARVEKKIKRRDGARSHAARSSVPSSRSAFVFPAWQWHSGSVRKRSGEINYARTPISMSRSLGRKRQRARARARSFVRFSFSLAPVRSLAIASRIRNYHSLIPRCSSSGPVTVRESSGVAAPSRAARNRACRTRLERKYADRACPDRVERHGAKRGL